MNFWMNFWWWWLVTVAVTFGIAELTSLYLGKGPQWTLSDCIRRWAKAHHWLPMLVWGVSVALCIHWFGG